MPCRCAMVLLLDILQVFFGGENRGTGKTPAAFNKTNYEENPRGDILMKENTVFKPEQRPRIMKTNIKNITKYVATRITEIGFNVGISCSNKSKSRYLEVYLRDDHKILIRIADHPCDRRSRWRYRFDVHTVKPRTGSIDYIQLLDAIKSIAGNNNAGTPAKEEL